jgi:hypothetical protein
MILMKSKTVLGVDIGNVIIDFRGLDFKHKIATTEEYAATPPSAGVFPALKELNRHFDGDVFLISKATEWAQGMIRNWFKVHRFTELTGIDESHIHFVGERRDKNAVCEQLGITHFIDDRLEVLSHMIKTVPNLYVFMPDDSELSEFKEYLPMVNVARSWNDILRFFY